MNSRLTKGPLGKLLSVALAASLALTACGNAGSSASNGPSSTNTAENGAPTAATATGELVGKPWVTSILAGNLPSETTPTCLRRLALW